MAHIQRFYGSAWDVFTFKLFGEKKGKRFLQVLALGIFFAVGALIPFMNGAKHLTKKGQAATIPIYVIANDLYMFFWGSVDVKDSRVYQGESSSDEHAVLCVFNSAFCLLWAYASRILLELGVGLRLWGILASLTVSFLGLGT